MAEAEVRKEPLCSLTFYCSGRKPSGRPGKLQGFLLFFAGAAKISLKDSDFQYKSMKTFLQNILACVSRSLKSFILFDRVISLLGLYPKEIRNTD